MSFPCRHCGSRLTASRRELFLCLMGEISRPLGPFAWYDQRSPGACPPQSLFVLLSLVAIGISLPTAALWMMGYHFTTIWLVLVPIGLLACLAFDVLLTYRRYRAWGREWVCSDCRGVFLPATQST